MMCHEFFKLKLRSFRIIYRYRRISQKVANESHIHQTISVVSIHQTSSSGTNTMDAIRFHTVYESARRCA